MNNSESVQALWERVKTPGISLDGLSALLEDYKTVLAEVMASGDDYRSGLRRQQEELPDLQRLVGKKHDVILKGRLQDAIGAVKKKLEAIEKPAPAKTETPALLGADVPVIGLGEDEPRKPARNMPTLGMD